MVERADPVFRGSGDVVLVGAMAIYDSHAEAVLGIPAQWRRFLLARPELGCSRGLYGASPCSSDRKIHYLTGVAWDGVEVDGERLTLVAGEYAVVCVEDAKLLRETWMWLLEKWLPASGRRERRAPEFERYSGISEAGTPVGTTEIWIPLEPLGA